jgi:hypothetical protein
MRPAVPNAPPKRLWKAMSDGTYPASGLHAAQEASAVGESGPEGGRVAGFVELMAPAAVRIPECVSEAM